MAAAIGGAEDQANGSACPVVDEHKVWSPNWRVYEDDGNKRWQCMILGCGNSWRGSNVTKVGLVSSTGRHCTGCHAACMRVTNG